ncbi:hypothetical protein [uncultured Anaerococcus sp.]|uniref:hypothetical protein n=1 Tax=uncultured Anaerococcus sp. TaxID=293428 RepID=UPI00288BF76B|nr:hypothetical protein [uncultured Anaerococcus sp.]
MDRRKRSESKEYKNPKTREKKRRIREKKRKRRTFGPYFLIFILFVAAIFFGARSLSHNVDRTVARIEKAIKTDDTAFMEENMDRLDVIFEVLKKSYSDDKEKQDEFVRNNFKNLDIKVLNKVDIDGGMEVSLKISNVNYITCFDKVKNLEKENQHEAYMRELSKDGAEVKSMDAKIFLKKKLFGYEIFESRDFINGIIGGALDLVK